ncbi:C2H2-type zinc finger protein [Arsenicibacter rosenii]|uniref:C2H2-type domain-containing protein n=1 Tax=Arsenicibacter rosenii TaxID=1750698 RepID=A0A1S2VB43_9BACT|nr:C2H2-type zinc finger protein [Arsenicibacter rosenii]OIN55640.1 hypothetical protein BLX24_29085 [Arsenicibacter rosenii]
MNLRPVSEPYQPTICSSENLSRMDEAFTVLISDPSGVAQRNALRKLELEAYTKRVNLGQWLKEKYYGQFMAEMGMVAMKPAEAPPVVVATEPFTCQVCGQKFSSQPALNGHQKAHRS